MELVRATGRSRDRTVGFGTIPATLTKSLPDNGPAKVKSWVPAVERGITHGPGIARKIDPKPTVLVMRRVS
jgi:hypothetical protein